MPGQGVVTIRDKQWIVSLATTYVELVRGLATIPAIAPRTGMLFILPSNQTVQVTTQLLRFSIDIVFINSQLKVIDVARNISPGMIVSEATPTRYVLEVNATETAGIEKGDVVNITVYRAAAIDVSQIVPLAVVGLISGMIGGIMTMVAGGSSPKQLKGGEKHHTMWLTPEQRAELEKKYGAVATRWGEEMAPVGDIKFAEFAARRFYERLKEILGIGHLSPELTEEQLQRLRKALGTIEEPPELARMREKGWIR